MRVLSNRLGVVRPGDRTSGDYRRLAYISYTRLDLELEPDCPEKWKPLLASEAAKLQTQRGQAYPVTTCGQTVTLGGD